VRPVTENTVAGRAAGNGKVDATQRLRPLAEQHCRTRPGAESKVECYDEKLAETLKRIVDAKTKSANRATLNS
jgi:hypothetical protein